MISDRVLYRLLRSDHRVRLYGDLVRGLAIAAAIVAVVWCALFYTMLARNMYTNLYMNDFGKFYYSARAFLDGGDMYGPNPATTVTFDATQARLANMNPPHFHLLVLPLARLSPLAALLVWAAVSAVALAFSIRVISRELRVTWTWTRVFWMTFAAIVFSATGINIVTGQMTFLMLLPLTLAWAAARHGRWVRAAILLGVLASVKPFLVIFAPYLLLKGRARAVAAFALAGAACVGVGLLIFHWTTYKNWLHALSAVNWSWLPMNGSIHGLLTRSLSQTPVFAPIINAPAAVRPLFAIGIVLVVGASAVALWRDKTEQSVDRAFAILLLAALLVSPLGWMYYAWLLAAPAIALVSAEADVKVRPTKMLRLRNAMLIVALPGLLCPVFVALIGSSHRWAGPTIGSIYLWTYLALWLAILMDGHAADRAARTT